MCQNSLLFRGWITFHLLCICHILSSHSSISGDLGCFHFLLVVTSIAMTVGYRYLLETLFLLLSGMHSSVGKQDPEIMLFTSYDFHTVPTVSTDISHSHCSARGSVSPRVVFILKLLHRKYRLQVSVQKPYNELRPFVGTGCGEEDSTLMDGSSALTEWIERVNLPILPFHLFRHAWTQCLSLPAFLHAATRCHLGSREWVITRHQICHCLDLGLSSLQNSEK